MNDLINRYLGMNAETRKQTIMAAITALIDFLSAFHIIEFTDDQIQAIYKLALCIVTAIVWGYCSHYKNNDFTATAAKHTAEMRQEKRELEDGYVGERFFTEKPEVIEEIDGIPDEEPEEVGDEDE